jgi:hypothetical protein
MKKLLLPAALLLAACASVDMAGYYEGIQPAASGGAERIVGVNLRPDGTAIVTSAFSGRPSRFLVRGRWDNDGDLVTIELPTAPIERIVFQHDKDRLVGKTWERSTWGEAGPGTLELQK